jgi:pimeloyl-ACP methyl ester carboxylesterase
MAYTGPYLLAAIDGTGSEDWMNAQGSNSHVFQFFREMNVNGGCKAYFHGPDTLGYTTGDIARNVLSFFNQAMRRYPNPPPRIVLIGHSRGGLVAIHVAARLPREVSFLGLYDAVDMNLGFDETAAIRNVAVTFHALRDPSLGSRSSWGNTGTGSVTGQYQSRQFMTSHGGIGGDVVTDPEFDVIDNPSPDYTCADRPSLRRNIELSLGFDRVEQCQTDSRNSNIYIREGAARNDIVFDTRAGQIRPPGTGALIIPAFQT